MRCGSQGNRPEGAREPVRPLWGCLKAGRGGGEVAHETGDRQSEDEEGCDDNGDECHGGDGGQQEGSSQLPEDLEQLLEDVGDGELDPQVQQVLEIQHQAGVGEGQLNTQEFEGRFFVQ